MHNVFQLVILTIQLTTKIPINQNNYQMNWNDRINEEANSHNKYLLKKVMKQTYEMKHQIEIYIQSNGIKQIYEKMMVI